MVSCSFSGGVHKKDGDSKDNTVTFEQAQKRENIASGEKHSILFGKIFKWFADLKTVAFTGNYNDLSNTPKSLPASDVYSWAKQSTKPSYNASEVGAAATSHTHSGYAASNHSHSGYAASSHSHSNYALKENPYFSGTITIDTGGKIARPYANQLAIYTSYNDCTKEEGIFISSGKAAQNYSSIYGVDNACSCGSANQRWRQVYAVNGAISTSDRNEKKEISYIGRNSYFDTCITDEQLVNFIMGLLPVVFKRINGDSDRPHHGIIAQDFEELLEKVGLNDHAAFIKSPKTKNIEIEKKVEKEDGTVEIIKEAQQEEIPDEYIYGIRYEELISDVIRFCQILYSQNQELEKRIEILEAKNN